MDFVSKEFVSSRMAEALEERLHASEKFQQQMKRLREVSHTFVSKAGKKQGNWKLYDKLESEWIQYNSLYGEEAYLLEVEDGVCFDIKLFGEDEFFKYLYKILDD